MTNYSYIKNIFVGTEWTLRPSKFAQAELIFKYFGPFLSHTSVNSVVSPVTQRKVQGWIEINQQPAIYTFLQLTVSLGADIWEKGTTQIASTSSHQLCN